MTTQQRFEAIDWAYDQGVSIEIAEAFASTVELLGAGEAFKTWPGILADIERAAWGL